VESEIRTVRDLFDKALSMKLRDVPWHEIHDYLIKNGHYIGHMQISELGDKNGYELTFETGERISFDGTDYHYKRPR
jgi:hypothetical protein